MTKGQPKYSALTRPDFGFRKKFWHIRLQSTWEGQTSFLPAQHENFNTEYHEELDSIWNHFTLVEHAAWGHFDIHKHEETLPFGCSPHEPDWSSHTIVRMLTLTWGASKIPCRDGPRTRTWTDTRVSTRRTWRILTSKYPWNHKHETSLIKCLSSAEKFIQRATCTQESTSLPQKK